MNRSGDRPTDAHRLARPAKEKQGNAVRLLPDEKLEVGSMAS